MRILRYLWRMPLLLVHLLLAVPTAWIAQSRWAKRRSYRGQRLDQQAVRWWAGRFLRIIGIHPVARGEPRADPVMFVANHVSWLDIVLVHSQRAVCFVAKAEIERWPMVGWMAQHAGTIFHRRGNTASMARVVECMHERLGEGRAVAVFPEGSTGATDRVRTFHARLLQAALSSDAPIQPVALRYSRDGEVCADVAFRRGESFFPAALRLVGGPPMQAEVQFLEVLDNRDAGRKAIAALARQRVADALDLE